MRVNEADSNAVLAQSIGGGGGNGGVNVTGAISASTNANATNVNANIGVGGFGGGGGSAQAVDLTFSGSALLIDHDNDETFDFWDANGLVAQSIGGGGGNGGVNVSAGVALTQRGSRGEAVTIGVGGFAGDGGDAGFVTLNTNLDSTRSTNTIQANGNGKLGAACPKYWGRWW